MLLSGYIFFNNKCRNYLDWGTLPDWQKYCSEFKTLFVDIDGVLFENASPYKSPKWGESNPILKNIECLQKLYATGKYQIILTTARCSMKDDYTLQNNTMYQLSCYNVPYDHIIWNCQHGQRIIINDFAETNPYPTAVAINILRNSNDLEKYLTSNL